jgi:hypothetical protein
MLVLLIRVDRPKYEGFNEKCLLVMPTIGNNYGVLTPHYISLAKGFVHTHMVSLR